MSETNEKESSFLDLYIKGWKGFVLLTTITVGGMVALTIISKPEYHTAASLYLPPDPLARAAVATPGSTSSNPISILKGMADSDRAFQIVAKATGVERRKFTLSPKLLTTEEAFRASQLIIHSTSDSPEKSKAYINAMINALGDLSRDTGFTMAGRQAQAYELTLKARESELKEAQTKLAAFQKVMTTPVNPDKWDTAALIVKQKTEATTSLAAVDKQIDAIVTSAKKSLSQPMLPATIPAIRQWRDKLVQLQYEYNVARTAAGDLAPNVVRLKRQIVIANEQLNKELSSVLKGLDERVDPSVSDLYTRKQVLEAQIAMLSSQQKIVSEETKTFANLLREVTVLTSVTSTVREQYEKSRTEAEVDKIKWSVLDAPFTEEKPVNKSYVKNGAIGLFISVLLFPLFSTLLNLLRKRNGRP